MADDQDYDYSDLAQPAEQSVDYSDLSQPISAAQNLSSQAQQQGQPSSNYAADLAWDNQPINPLDLIKLALSRNKNFPKSGLYDPKQTANLVGKTAGKGLMMAQPELMEGPGLFSGLVNSAGRVGTVATGMTMQNLDNVNSMSQLGKDFLSNLKSNAMIEAAPMAARGIGGMAELVNPQKYGEKFGNQIEQGFNAADQKRQAAYAPVNAKYDDYLTTVNPKNYLKFDPEDEQYFTGDVKRSLNTFNNEPNFRNLHDLQSQMGRDWAKVSTSPDKIDTAQALNYSRKYVQGKIQKFLSQDKDALAQYNLGQKISHEEYYPYLSSPNLSAISEGRKLDVDANQLAKEIRKGQEKRTGAIPSDHPLVEIGDKLQDKLNRGEAMRYLMPAAAGAVSGEYFNPGIGGPVSGALAGLGFGRWIEPSMLKLAQNPWLIKHLENAVQPLYYGGSRGFLNYNNQKMKGR